MDEGNYALLGLSSDASLPEIKQAYRKMALKWHPDRHTMAEDKEHAKNVFGEMTTTYQALIRDRELASLTTKQFKARTRLPTPVPSYRSFSDDSQASISPSNSYFNPFNSNNGSHSTLPSSFNGSSSAQNCHTHTGKCLDPIQVTQVQASLQTTHDSSIPWKSPIDPELRPMLPQPSAEQIEREIFLQNVPRSTLSPASFSTWVAVPTRHPTQILTPGPPLPTLGVGGLGEWAYSLRLTLEDLFHGKRCRFYVVRHLLSGRTKNVIIEIDVPSGCRRGTRILCRGVGHELPNGTLQDVTFIVEEAPHVRFSRIEDDLYLDMRLPWTDRFTQRPERVGVRGIDGEEIILIIDYMQHKMLQGEVCVKGAGMAVRNKGQVVGRSDLIIRWEIQSPPTKVRHFLDRFLHPRPKR